MAKLCSTLGVQLKAAYWSLSRPISRFYNATAAIVTASGQQKACHGAAPSTPQQKAWLALDSGCPRRSSGLLFLPLMLQGQEIFVLPYLTRDPLV